MSGIKDLETLIASLEAQLGSEAFVFCTFTDQGYGAYKELEPLASFVEKEGLTLVIPERLARTAEISYSCTFRCISLRVHSSLEAVGLTAAVAETLASKGISTNVIAAFHHDHILVPSDRAEEAHQALKELSKLHKPIL